jgi:hypothetical protein
VTSSDRIAPPHPTPGRPRFPTTYRITVNPEDLARASRRDAYQCAVALAIKRTLPDATRIEVDSQTIRFTRDRERFVYLTPPVVEGYVIVFDAGTPLEPFAFTLHVRAPSAHGLGRPGRARVYGRRGLRINQAPLEQRVKVLLGRWPPKVAGDHAIVDDEPVGAAR